MKVLVTGGTGFLGRRLKINKPNWIYISSRDYDLREKSQCAQMFKTIKPDAVIHLAARVGGIKDNEENQALFYYENTVINTNVIHQAYLSGVQRLLAALSTCSFPDKVKEYPLTEKDLFGGPPAPTNFSYGFTKRAMHTQCISYRKQYGLNYSTFCPSNIYGPDDYFDSEKSHFVPAMITRIAKEDLTILKLWGTGKPLRQQLYVDDLCQIIPTLLEKHNSNIPIIVAPNENLSIRQMAHEGLKLFDKDVKLEFNNNLDGQYRKDGSNKELLKLIGDFEFTTFKEGLRKTYDWYVSSKKE